MPTWFGKLSLAARVTLAAMTTVFLIAVAVTWFIVHRDRESNLADRGALLANGVARNALRLGQGIDALRRDALVISRLPPVQGIPRALRNRGRDAKEGVPVGFWITRLQELFSAFAEANPDYAQIRYIGVADNGRELVRVDAAEGRAVVTPAEKLQSKGDREYFQATLKLKAGEVYLSRIDLNREWGRIQTPHVRTLRAATPVFTPDGVLYGMVVINLHIGPAIDAATTNLPPGIRGYMMNSEGDYLAHPDAGRTFGFDLGHRYTWQQDMPGLTVPSIAVPEQRPLQIVSTPEGMLHLAVERVNLDRERRGHFLLLAWGLPEAVVQVRLAEVRNTTIAAMAVIALFVCGVLFLLLRRAFVPLTRLTALAGDIGAGRYDLALPESGAGEMASFVLAFGRMLERIGARERELKEVNAALQSSESRLQTVVENLAEGVAVSDLDGRLLHFNRAAMELHGFTGAEEYLRRLPEFADTFELSAPDGTAWPVDQWPLARVLRGENLHDLEVRIRHLGAGWQRIFSYGGALARDAQGRPLMAVVTMRDITERDQAERKIRAQLAHLSLLDRITRAIGERQDLRSIFQVVIRSLEDSLPIDFGCVCLYDRPRNVLQVACVGIRSEPLAMELALSEQASIDIDGNGLGRCVRGQLVYEPDIGQARFPFPERLARGGQRSLVLAPLQSESLIFGVLVAARREAHAFSSVECEFLLQLSGHVALAAHQAQLYGALQQAYDDLRQTQQTILQQERLRALGQMASGIAHDINNAISPIALYTETMLETEPNLSAKGREYLATIQQAVEDVAATVSRMREFYRQREPQLNLAAVDLNRVVEQAANLTRARWYDIALQRGAAVELCKDLAPDLPAIMGIESEIREALTNLIFNAVDAMPEGGTLTLRSRRVETQADAGEAVQAPQVAVEVIDSGVGMDEDTRRRCLEPFYTTKGERGSGLGLAMVFGTVQRHSADLQIESTPGQGTTVRLIFAVPSAVVQVPAHAGAMTMPPRLRLLIVDDDPLLTKSLRDALETDGHDVTAAAGGKEGIELFGAARERNKPFAAVITDLGMPYVDGRKVAEAIKAMSPVTPVILLTGWGQRLLAEGNVPPHVNCVLAKPPKLRELRDALARCCAPKQP